MNDLRDYVGGAFLGIEIMIGISCLALWKMGGDGDLLVAIFVVTLFMAKFALVILGNVAKAWVLLPEYSSVGTDHSFAD